jgi:hypothetical protein
MRQTSNLDRPFRSLSDMQVADMIEKLKAEARQRTKPAPSFAIDFTGMNHNEYYRDAVPRMHAAYEAHRAWEKENA